MKSIRILAAFVAMFSLVLLLTQSSGAGAQTTPHQPASMAVGNGGFSAKLTRPNDQAPYLITFQGRLTDHSGNPITSPTNLTFKLYTVPSGGSAIFTEGPVSVTPNAQGLLTDQVGSTVSINAALIAQFANSLYLGVAVASDAEMTPRLALTAAPYAMSLAPGAVVSSSYSGTVGQYGVVNAINTNLSSPTNVGLYGKGATAVYGKASSSGGTSGYGGIFSNAGGGSGVQAGISVDSTSTGGTDGYGGDFLNAGGGSGTQYGISASTNSSGASTGYGGSFTNNGGGSGIQYGINASSSSSGTAAGYGGYIVNNGGGSGEQEGIYVENHSTSGAMGGAGGDFENAGGGSGQQYGVVASSPGIGLYGLADNSTGSQQSAGVAGQSIAANGAGGVFTGTSAVVGYSSSSGNTTGYGGNFTNNGGGSGNQYGIHVNNLSTSGTQGYGGWFFNGGGGSGVQYGIYSYAPTTGGSGGYSGYFSSDSNTATAVYVYGKVQATGGCCASAFYDTQVQYHGITPLHPGDVVAADGNNETVDGTPTLGVVKANAQNADLALGVVQYRMKKIGTEKDGRSDWQVDEQAASFGAGDLLSAVVLGQVRMKVPGASLGSHLALAADGSINVAAKGADNLIGKVVSQPDKDGYITVFVNLK